MAIAAVVTVRDVIRAQALAGGRCRRLRGAARFPDPGGVPAADRLIAQVMTVGASRPVRPRISATSSAVAIRPASAACVSWSCFFGSGSKRSR